MTVKSKNIFDFEHYRDYLRFRLRTTGATRGKRKALADRIGTRPSFISNVLSGQLNLSPEHIPPANSFLQHTKDEGQYFALLVFHARAGTKELEKYYEDQINEALKKRASYSGRVPVREVVSGIAQATFFSRWYYAAVHNLVTIPAYQTKEAIAQRLGLSVDVVLQILDWLLENGLIEASGPRYLATKKRIHLPKTSPWISHYHMDCRHRAIQRIPEPEENSLHFSQIISVSKADFLEYRKRLLDLIAEFDPIIHRSSEEELYLMNLDLLRY